MKQLDCEELDSQSRTHMDLTWQLPKKAKARGSKEAEFWGSKKSAK